MQDDIRASLDDLAIRWETPKGRELKKQVKTMENIIRQSKMSIETLEEDKASLEKQLQGSSSAKKPLQPRNFS